MPASRVFSPPSWEPEMVICSVVLKNLNIQPSNQNSKKRPGWSPEPKHARNSKPLGWESMPWMALLWPTRRVETRACASKWPKNVVCQDQSWWSAGQHRTFLIMVKLSETGGDDSSDFHLGPFWRIFGCCSLGGVGTEVYAIPQTLPLFDWWEV